MRNHSKPLLGLIGGAALALGCGGTPVDPYTPPAMVGDECPNDGGAITGTLAKSCRLSAARRWTLKGQVTVGAGATLTIEPGTTIVGEYNPMRVAYLVVDRGAKIMAVGTKDKPIVFTSARTPGDRAPGDWGGVVLKGRASVNLPGGEADLEGEAGKYGGGASPDDNDSSGELRYVRIEFAGKIYTKDVELNGLTLGAVGRGTKIEYVQVLQGLDDGFEMFGGTVDLKHCVASAVQDDGFDWDYGWRGRGQFLIVHQDVIDGNNGIEADNNEKLPDAQPLSSPTLYNVTLVGTGRGSQAMKQKRFGLTLRRGTAGSLHNFIVYGFDGMLGGAGLVLDQEATVARAEAGQLEISHSLFFQNGKDDTLNLSNITTIGTRAFDVKGWVLGRDRMNREEDPRLARPFDAAPDLRPVGSSPALVSGNVRQPPQDGFFQPVSHIGALDMADDWLAGWTAFPKN